MRMKDDLERQYEAWKEIVGHEHSWSSPFRKLSFKYNNGEFQQVHRTEDIFVDIDQVRNVCGNGDSFEEAVCWLDSYNWSLMNKTSLTEDIYQFISHNAHIIRKGIDKEIANFSIDWEAGRQGLEPIIQYLYENGSQLLYFVFNLIIGGM